MCVFFFLYVCVSCCIDALVTITVSWLLHAYLHAKLGFCYFILFSLFNTYYLLSNENPLFVILSLVACVLLFFADFHSLLFTFMLLYCSRSLFVCFFFSLFDIFDSLSSFFILYSFHIFPRLFCYMLLVHLFFFLR